MRPTKGTGAAGLQARARAVAHAPSAIVPMGSTCYVGLDECTLRACVVLVGASTAMSVADAPAIGRARSSRRCADASGVERSETVTVRPAAIAPAPAPSSRLRPRPAPAGAR
ncbi:MAG: hypothetical protein ABSH51_25715 [Solirubrobacteraceae bacterium]